MKKITIQRAHELLLQVADGVNPEEGGATTEEIMLAARMGAVAIYGLGKVGTLAVDMANDALMYTNAIKQLEGDVPVNRVVDGPNGAA